VAKSHKISFLKHPAVCIRNVTVLNFTVKLRLAIHKSQRLSDCTCARFSLNLASSTTAKLKYLPQLSNCWTTIYHRAFATSQLSSQSIYQSITRIRNDIAVKILVTTQPRIVSAVSWGPYLPIRTWACRNSHASVHFTTRVGLNIAHNWLLDRFDCIVMSTTMAF